jgi:hypothetical protein
MALFGVWNLPGIRHLPFPSPKGQPSNAPRTTGASRPSSPRPTRPELLLSNPTAANDANWRALNQVIRRQARFLTWYFALIALEGVCFGLLARHYGDWRGNAGRYRMRLWLIRTFILPNISEWHLLLTSFNWPRREDVDVSIDILQNDGILYQGRVADYFIAPDGKLTGILLENVSRFDREAYHEAQKSSSVDSTTAQPTSSAAFWRTIPGSRFYIGQSSILNLNVRFVARDQTLISLAEKILDAEDSNTYEVTVESEEESSRHPDIYS